MSRLSDVSTQQPDALKVAINQQYRMVAKSNGELVQVQLEADSRQQFLTQSGLTAGPLSEVRVDGETSFLLVPKEALLRWAQTTQAELKSQHHSFQTPSGMASHSTGGNSLEELLSLPVGALWKGAVPPRMAAGTLNPQQLEQVDGFKPEHYQGGAENSANTTWSQLGTTYLPWIEADGVVAPNLAYMPQFYISGNKIELSDPEWIELPGQIRPYPSPCPPPPTCHRDLPFDFYPGFHEPAYEPFPGMGPTCFDPWMQPIAPSCGSEAGGFLISEPQPFEDWDFGLFGLDVQPEWTDPLGLWGFSPLESRDIPSRQKQQRQARNAPTFFG